MIWSRGIRVMRSGRRRVLRIVVGVIVRRAGVEKRRDGGRLRRNMMIVFRGF